MYTHGASDRVLDYIINQIKTGELKPGDKLESENTLASRLDVSRTSVRKAMDQLVGNGVITKRQGAGAFVNAVTTQQAMDLFLPTLQVNTKELFDILEFRKTFEQANVKMLKNHITPEFIQALESIYAKMEDTKDELGVFYEYDYEFHRLIAEATENVIVIKILELLVEMMRSQQAILYQKIGPSNGIFYHEKILEELKNGDTTIASMYMYRHMETTIEELKEVLP